MHPDPHRRFRVIALSVCAFGTAALPVAADGPRYDAVVVAASGRAIEGDIWGGTLDDFYWAVLDNSGRICMQTPDNIPFEWYTYDVKTVGMGDHLAISRVHTSRVQGIPQTVSTFSLRMGPPAELYTVLSKNDPVQGMPGETWNSLPDIVAINAHGAGAIGTDDGIWRVLPPLGGVFGDAPIVTLIARSGSTDVGGLWSDLRLIGLNDGGDALFHHRWQNLVGSGWSLRVQPMQGNSAVIASSGQAAPGGGVFVAEEGPRCETINSAGQIAFEWQASGAGPLIDGWGVWRYTPGVGLEAIARRGTPAGGGAVLNSGTLPGGQPIGVRPVVGSDGTVAFGVVLSGPNVSASNDSAIYVSTGPGNLRRVAREGDVVPGMGGEVFGSLGAADVAVDPKGNVLITAPVAGAGGRGLFRLPADGGALERLLAPGLPFVVDGQVGVIVTVSAASRACNGENGRSSWVNGSGEIAVRMVFGDGSQSAAKAATILLTPFCPADFNRDGEADAQDITALLSAWFADRAAGTGTANFDDDADVDAADITAFLSAWFATRAAGC